MVKAVLVLVISCGSLAAFGLEYWPVQPDGVVYHYQRAYGDGWDMIYSNDGDTQHREYRALEHPQCSGGENYAISDSMVALASHSIYCGGIDPSFDIFEPPIPVARAGMETGDSWIWTGYCAYGTAMILATVTVETITLTFGTYEALRVDFIPIFGSCSLPYSHVYLQRDYGPVRQDDLTLIGWDGPVRTEQKTWSSLKSTFR